MNAQLAIVGVLVVLALAYLSRQTLRTWIGKKAGCSGCKCGATKTSDSATPPDTLIPIEQVTLRRRG